MVHIYSMLQIVLPAIRNRKGRSIALRTDLAGGFEFKMPVGGVVRSANITPDAETGIAKWTEEMFVNRFKSYTDSTYKTC